jgi:hypothetical protein
VGREHEAAVTDPGKGSTGWWDGQEMFLEGETGPAEWLAVVTFLYLCDRVHDPMDERGPTWHLPKTDLSRVGVLTAHETLFLAETEAVDFGPLVRLGNLQWLDVDAT